MILKQPSIVLVDEGTSALDSQTESEILESLRDSTRGRTTIVIAHRLSTIVDADRIIVLSGGRVAESGTHAELLALGGRYAHMWQMQSQTQAQRNQSKVASSAGVAPTPAPVARL